jgi:uncharacterized protein
VYEWDEAKREANIRKHGIDFYPAAWYFEWEHLWITFVDDRQDYGEERFIAFAPIRGRLHCMYYTTPTTGLIRVIGLRKTNNREVKKYAKYATKDD